MKTQIAFKLAALSPMAITLPTVAQTFSGTNAPNTGTDFSFSVGAGATNLSLVNSNSATVYSHLYLKRGGPAATNDFDFVARLNAQTNQINLELPEFMATSYGLRVVTPAASGIVNIYSDGILRLTYNDASGFLTVSSAAAMRFFNDDGVTEESPGYVARIRNFATALSASDAIALDREPGSFAGPFILSSASLNAQNQFYFTITGPAGVSCSLQSSTNLLNWTTLSNIATFPGSMNYTSPATGRAQFFRVKQ